MASAAQFEAVLKTIVADVREQEVSNLSGGGPEDYPTYREAVGFIRCLDQISEWCAEAYQKLDER